MTPRYENFGVGFQYPENWKIVDEQPDDWPRSVSVQSPGSGFWMLQIFPAVADPATLAADVLKTIQQEYQEVEAESVHEPLAGVNTLGHDLTFYCLDLIVAARTRAFPHGDRTFLLLWQAEDREFDQLEPVFRAISVSLLRTIAATSE